MDVSHVFLIEDGRHRMERLKRLAQLVEQRRFEDARVLRGLEGVVLVDVPSAEHEVVEIRERNEILDERSAALGTLAEANGRKLRERSDWRAESALHRLDTGDEGGADRAHARHQHAELAGRGRDADVIFLS